MPFPAAIGIIGSVLTAAQAAGGAGMQIGKRIKQRRANRRNQDSEPTKSSGAPAPQEPSASAGATLGLPLRPQWGSPGVGMGTISMFPPMGAQQQMSLKEPTPMFTMQQQGQPGGQMFQQQSVNAIQAAQDPNAPTGTPAKPQQGAAFSTMGAMINNGRGRK